MTNGTKIVIISLTAAVGAFLIYFVHGYVAPDTDEDDDNDGDDTTVDMLPIVKGANGKYIASLRANALNALTELVRVFPEAIVTSGSRNPHEQSIADAHNVAADPSYLKIHHGIVHDRMVAAQSGCHPESPTYEYDLQRAFESVLDEATDAERSGYSLHSTGDAYDVGPNTNKHNPEIKAALESLVEQAINQGCLAKFSEPPKDPAWHSQFPPTPLVSFHLPERQRVS